MTTIYATRKLEKNIAEIIVKNEKSKKNEYLGDWSATLFYISRKKCWLIINKRTKYVVILPNVKKADLNNIPSIFKKTFYQQLIYDGIKTDYLTIERMIGDVILCETDNDKQTNGSLNVILTYFDEYWKYEFGHFDNMPFREITGRINSLANKQLDWLYPKEKMNEMIKAFTGNKNVTIE